MECFAQNAPSSMFDKVLNTPPRFIRKSAYMSVDFRKYEGFPTHSTKLSKRHKEKNKHPKKLKKSRNCDFTSRNYVSILNKISKNCTFQRSRSYLTLEVTF